MGNEDLVIDWMNKGRELTLKELTLKEYLFICVSGCGDFKLSEMKASKESEDPTIVCPKCGCCTWYISPKKDGA